MFKEMYRETFSFSTPTQLHYGDDWDLDSSEFDELKDNFIDGFIWEDLTDSKNKKDNGSE